MHCARGFRSLCNEKATCALGLQPDPSGSGRTQADPDVLQLYFHQSRSAAPFLGPSGALERCGSCAQAKLTYTFAQPINSLEFPNCAGVCAALSGFNIYFAQWHCAGY